MLDGNIVSVPLGSAPNGRMHTTDAILRESTDDRNWSKSSRNVDEDHLARKRVYVPVFLYQIIF